MEKNFLTLFLIFSTLLKSFSQNNDSAFHAYIEKHKPKEYKQYQIVLGYNLQGNWGNKASNLHYFEIGFGKSLQYRGYHGGPSFGFIISEEFHFGEENIYGTKAGLYTHYMLDVGFSMVYYTNFKKGNCKFRPEIGIGLGGLRCVAGFNIPFIDNKAFETLQKRNAQATVQIMIPLKRKLIEKHKGIFQELLSK